MARKVLLLAFSFLLVVPMTGAGQPAPVAPPVLFDPNPVRGPQGPAVALTDDGFVVVWTVPRAQRGRLFARTFDDAGRPTSPAILLARPPSWSWDAAVARGAARTWVVIWNDGHGLVGGRFDAGDGTPLGEPFRISGAETTSIRTALCSDAEGAFVVVWKAIGDAEVFARRYDAHGDPLAAAWTVTAGAESDPGLACAPGGRFAVSWITTSRQCRAAFYDADGRPQGEPRQVSTAPTSTFFDPRLAMTSAGELAVLWDAPLTARFYDEDGEPLGPPRGVAEEGVAGYPRAVVTLSPDTYFVLWSERDLTLPFTPISAREFDAASGEPTSGARRLPEIWGFPELVAGGGADGRLVLAWSPYARLFNAGGPGLLGLDRDSFAASERDGEIAFTVRRTGGSGAAVDVDWATAAVSATPGVDYVPASGTLSFPAGDSQPRTLRVELLDDAAAEMHERVAIVLSNPTGGAGLTRVSRTDLQIRDDETPPPLRRRGGPIVVGGGDGARHETPAVALAADGSFAVAWRRGSGVVARRFSRGGEPLGPPMDAGMRSEHPAIVAHPGGGFSLVWQHNSYDALLKHGFGAAHLYLRHATARGAWGAPKLLHRGPEIFHGPTMSYVDLAAVGKNRLVAGGQLRNSSGHPEGGTVETLFFNVVGRLLRPARAVAGPDAMLGAAALGLRPDGSGLLLAGDAFDGSETGIAGAFLLPDGTAAGDLLGVNRVAAGIQEAPDVAALGNAQFLAVWQSVEVPGERAHVAGRVVHHDGRPIRDDVRISASPRFDNFAPKVAALGHDAALVVWESRSAGGVSEIRAQVVAASGALLGRELRIGGPAARGRHQGAVAANAAGQAVVVWQEVDGDGREAIRLQRLVPSP